MTLNLDIPDDALTGIKDQVVLITGGSSGIGRATAQLCLQLGAHVVIGDITPPQHDFEGAERLKFVRVDVSTWESVRALFVQAEGWYGRIDHVFANAGVRPTIDFLGDSRDETGQLAPPDLRAMNVNLIGAIYTVRLAVHYMKKLAGTGSVVLTASAASFKNFSASDYTVTKHGLLGVIRGLVNDLEGTLRLNAVAPSWTATGMVPTESLEALGVTAQAPGVVARSVVLLFVDRQRHGEVIYSWDGKYREVNKAAGGFLASAAGILENDANEESVLRKLREATNKI